MQPVVRLSLLGIFAVASLTACGDKVNVTQPPVTPIDSSVHTVTVSPPAASVAVGGTTQLAASVDAGAGQKVRTVTWTSSDATTASVDATGKVTGIKGGSVTIIAKSVADPSVSGASAITVTGGGVPTVTIQSIFQTTAAGSAPAVLTNAAAQLDITLNVEPNGQIIKTVTATITCGAKSKSASQTVSNLAPTAAEASAVPITLSINTAAFNTTTGVPDLNNGSCTLSATVLTGTGQQVATNSTPLTLNNTDMVIVKVKTNGATAADANGAPWSAGDVTVTAIPVLYSNTTLATANLGLPGANPAIQAAVPVTGSATAGFTASATWSGSSATAPSVKGVTLGTTTTPITATASFLDSQGNTVAPGVVAAPTSSPTIRIDNQAPPAVAGTNVVYTTGTQNTAANWVGKAFTFTKAITLDAAAKADNGGVDIVKFTTQWAPTGTTTWTTFSDVNTLAETSNSTSLDLRAVVCDALNNCANTTVLTQFGVDLTAPTASTATGPKANQIVGLAPSPALSGGGNIAVAASDPQGANGATGSGFGATPVLVSETQLAPSGATGQVQTCVIGVATTPVDGTCKTPLAQPLTFPIITVVPGQYALTYVSIDQAGNMSPSVASNYYLDQAAPAISGGISIPASIVAGSSFTSSGVDDMDFASAQAFLHYAVTGLPAGATGRFILPATSTAAGVPFDNVLARSSSITTTLPTNQFYRSLNTIAGAVITPANVVKPDFVGIRGTDAANNLSAPNQAALPAANIATGASPVIGTDLSDFTVSATPAAVFVAAAPSTNPRSATISAVVTATGPTAGTPFAQVCFYLQSVNGAENGQASAATAAATGDFVLLNCTPVTVTTGPTPKLITSTFTFTPTAAFGVGSPTYNIVAVGVTANGDAVLTTAPATVTVNP